jgi:hypothetical protein
VGQIFFIDHAWAFFGARTRFGHTRFTKKWESYWYCKMVKGTSCLEFGAVLMLGNVTVCLQNVVGGARTDWTLFVSS